CVDEVLAQVGHHQAGHLVGLSLQRFLNELDMPLVDVGEAAGVVVAVAAQDGQLRGLPWARRWVVPLAARDLARLAADADRCVGVETYGLSHISRSAPRAGSSPRLALRGIAARHALPTECHPWAYVASHLTFSHVAHEHLRLMNRHVRIADEGGEIINDVAGGDALIAPVPGQADVMDGLLDVLVADAVADAEGLDAAGDERLGADRAARGRDHHPV